MLKWFKAPRRDNVTFEPTQSTAESQRPVFEFVPEGWARQQGDSRIKGWAVDAIVAANRAAWPSFLEALNSDEPLAVTPEAPPGTAPTWRRRMRCSRCLRRGIGGARAGGLSILDWGGAIGQHALVARRMVPDVDFDYHSVDTPGLSALGRELNSGVTFYNSTSEAFFRRTYDFVMASGALQYVADWRATLARLAASTGTYLYLARLPTIERVPSYVMVQRPYAFGYDTEYLSWCVNRDELFEAATSAGLTVFREFLGSNSIQITGAPEQCRFRSFLFHKSTKT